MKSKSNPKNHKPDNMTLRIIMLILMMISIGILIGTVSYTLVKVNENKQYENKVISYTEFNSSVEITRSSTGLNADRDGVKYGKTVPGGRGTRFININTSEYAFVQVFFAGDLAPYMSVENNSFYMDAGEFISLPVYLDVPDDAEIGFYTGKVYVMLTRPDSEPTD